MPIGCTPGLPPGPVEAFRPPTPPNVSTLDDDQGNVLGSGYERNRVMAKKMGRPEMAEDVKRGSRLPAIRLTVAEKNDLDLKAEADGLDLSSWVRQHLTNAPAPKRTMAPTDASLITELNRIGNNVNQIARQVNRGRDHDPEHLGHVMFQLNSVLENLVRRYGS
jgi:hypothetical protein